MGWVHIDGYVQVMSYFYKRVGLPDPLLTFWLTVVGNTSQSTIPTLNTHWVTGALNPIIVELFLPVDLSPVNPRLPTVAQQPRMYFLS